MPKVLGHATRYREEKSVPGIKIGGIRPGGIVDVVTPSNPDLMMVDMPTKITAVYIPVEHLQTASANVTPDSVLGSGGISGSADVPPEGGNVTIRVAGVKPGEYEVQLILEYPDAAPPPPPPPPV